MQVYNFVLLPKNSDPVYLKRTDDLDTESEDLVSNSGGNHSPITALPKDPLVTIAEEKDAKTDGLTLAIIFPIVAFVLLDATCGYINCITVPYLVDKFDMTVTQGGRYLFVHAASLGAGWLKSCSSAKLL